MTPSTKFQVHTTLVSHLTLGDPWWLRTDLQIVWHRTISPSAKFHFHTTNYTDLTLNYPWWPWTDLQYLQHRTISPPTKFHFPSSNRTDLTLGDPNDLELYLCNFSHRNISPPTKFHSHRTLTPDDPELTSKTFGIKQYPHPPSFTSIRQTIQIWPLCDLQNVWHQTISPPIKFHFHKTNYTDLTFMWPPKCLASDDIPTHQVSLP